MAKKKRNIKAKKENKTRPKRKNEPKEQLAKPKTIREALQMALNKELIKKNDNGKKVKTTFLEELVSKAIEDAIANDGPTRRLLFKPEILDLEIIGNQELKVSPSERSEINLNDPSIVEVEKEYGKLLRQFAEMDPKYREYMNNMMSQLLVDEMNRMALAKRNE